MEVVETDWMIMGMIHAYKVLGKTRSEREETDFNDVDYLYLAELQRRNIEKPALISAEFPYTFQERNSSAHDQICLGMMNVFTMLEQRKKEDDDLNTLDVDFLINSLVEELEEEGLAESYDDFFQIVAEKEGLR